jgi:hypothetical protein
MRPGEEDIVKEQKKIESNNRHSRHESPSIQQRQKRATNTKARVGDRPKKMMQNNMKNPFVSDGHSKAKTTKFHLITIN